MKTTTEFRSGDAFGGGVLAGLAAGLLLEIVMFVVAVAAGHDPWPPMKIAGIAFLGPDRALSTASDPAAVTVGLCSHFLVSAAWGGLFGMIAFGRSHRTTLILGALYGIVVWLGMDLLVMPAVGAAFLRTQVPVPMAIAQHVVFGLVLAAAFLPFQQRLPRAERLRHAPVGA
jgi:hypothetical protein